MTEKIIEEILLIPSARAGFKRGRPGRWPQVLQETEIGTVAPWFSTKQK
jgi:hypothetical protein